MSTSNRAPAQRTLMTPFEAALRKLPLDQYTLIPLHKPFDTKTKNGVKRSVGKAPIDKNWTKASYDSEAIIERCVREKRNAGVRLTSEQIVIDIDPRNGGDVSYELLFAELGIDESIFPRVVTGSGGLHLYCLNPKGVPVLDTLGEDYQGVEFKSKGRQVVAPGSIHPDTMKPYVWDDKFPKLEDAPEIPPRLLKLIRKPMANSQTRGGGGEYDQQQIAAMLDHLDARKFNDQKKWLNMLMACHHASKGDARSEFIEWSISDPQYRNDAAIIGRRWDSLHRDKLGGIKAGTLEMYMRDAGATNAIPYKGVKAIPSDEWADGDASLAEHIEGDDEFEADAATEGDFEDDGEFEAAKPFKWDMNRLSDMLTFAERSMLDGGAPLYQMLGRLVHPVRADADCEEDAVRRKAGSLTVRELSPPRLQNFMIEHASFYRPKVTKQGTKNIPFPATAQLAQHYLAAGDTWRLPVLKGIAESPTLRADGTVIQDQGYDPESRLLLDFGGVAFPRVKDRPTRSEALKALGALKEPFADFPFVTEDDGWDSASLSVMLGAVLTGLVRRSLPSAPMFGVSAPTAGTGKSLAIDVVSMIVQGRPAAAMSQGASAEEDEKRLGSSLIRGDQMLVLDNVTRPIAGDALCSILTQQSWTSRILGESRIVELNTNVLLMASGNQLSFAGDMTRRALLCRLDAGVERPEERRFNVDLKETVPARRVELVVAGLTVLRAFVAAGRPGLGALKPYGSFEAWSNLVRGALVWLGESDLCITTDWIREDDPVRESLEQLLLSIYSTSENNWFGAGELIEEAERSVDDSDRRLDAITAAVGAKFNKMSFGMYLKANVGRIVLGMRLERKRDAHTKSWKYRVVKLS